MQAKPLSTDYSIDKGSEEPASPLGSESPSSSTASPPSSISPHYDDKRDIICVKEFLSDEATKRITRGIWAVVAVGVGLLIAAAVAKTTKSEGFFIAKNDWYMMNMVLASIQILLLLAYWVYFVRRVVRSTLSGKRWSERRWKGAVNAFVHLTLQLLNSVMYLIPNARVIAVGCNFFLSHSGGNLMAWASFVSWTCLNSIFFLYTVQAANMHPLPRRVAKRIGRPDAIKLDGPWWVHWPLLPLWIVMESFLLALTIVIVRFSYFTLSGDPQLPAEGSVIDCDSTNFDGIVCHTAVAQQVLSSLVAATSVVYFLVYCYLVRQVFVALYQLPYNTNRIANMIIRVQIRQVGIAYFFFIAAIIVYFYVEYNTCESFFVSWMGFTPAQLVLTAVALVQAYLATPQRPQASQILQVWLQEFAWLENDIGRKQRERASSLPPDSVEGFCMDCEPLFCFETAVKLCYWSFLVYDTAEDAEAPFNPKTARQLFGLTNFDVVWEEKTKSKAVIGWNDDTVVVAFRGTANVKNMVSDLQVWRVRHPPDAGGASMLGTVSMVHTGFYSCYTYGGFNDRLLSHVEHILYRCRRRMSSNKSEGGFLGSESGTIDNSAKGNNFQSTEERPVRVFVTGHSLGGAMAVLCAYDIATRVGSAELGLDIKCYTFGAPRVGNHAWARLYNVAVPETWQVINSDDAVTRAGKFWFLYKHVGNRVLINRRGDIIVRPSFAEYSIRRSPGGSVADHYLTAYQRAMMAVVSAQFGRKSLSGRKIDVIELTREEGTRLALGGVGLSPDDLRKLDESEAEVPAWPYAAGALDEETQRANALQCLGTMTCLEMRIGQWLEAASAFVEGRHELKEVPLQADFTAEISQDLGGLNVSSKASTADQDNGAKESIPKTASPTQLMEATRQSYGCADMARQRTLLFKKNTEAGLLQCHTLCRLARGRGREAVSEANQYGDSEAPKATDIETGTE